jgi:nanoRNase/pAp phosphatase (c-di-AMP/oligoRNAs hydrolase)
LLLHTQHLLCCTFLAAARLSQKHSNLSNIAKRSLFLLSAATAATAAVSLACTPEQLLSLATGAGLQLLGISPTADFTRTGCESNDSEGLIDHIRAIEPVVVACVFEELEPELTRISLRSKTARINVNEIAAQFGGGGHSAAAGARIPGRPLAVQRRVIAAVKRALQAI